MSGQHRQAQLKLLLRGKLVLPARLCKNQADGGMCRQMLHELLTKYGMHAISEAMDSSRSPAMYSSPFAEQPMQTNVKGALAKHGKIWTAFRRAD